MHLRNISWRLTIWCPVYYYNLISFCFHDQIFLLNTSVMLAASCTRNVVHPGTKSVLTCLELTRCPKMLDKMPKKVKDGKLSFSQDHSAYKATSLYLWDKAAEKGGEFLVADGRKMLGNGWFRLGRGWLPRFLVGHCSTLQIACMCTATTRFFNSVQQYIAYIRLHWYILHYIAISPKVVSTLDNR